MISLRALTTPPTRFSASSNSVVISAPEARVRAGLDGLQIGAAGGDRLVPIHGAEGQVFAGTQLRQPAEVRADHRRDFG